MDQGTVVRAGTRIAPALALSMMLFLPTAYATSTITLTSPNARLQGSFGWSVAVSGTTVVVGAIGETAFAAGSAHVLDTTTGVFTTLTSPNPISGGAFGVSVAVSGTTVVVGAYREMAGATTMAGNAYVFDATGGPPITTLATRNAIADGNFGYSVAVSGTTVVVGAPGETGNGKTRAGHAYVFDTTDLSSVITLTSPNADDFGGFGWSVAVSGMTVVVGAPDETIGAATEAGNAYVFDATDGSPITTLTTGSAAFHGLFGWSVAVSGTTVVVGAPGETANLQPFAGQAHVFDATTGSPITTLTSPYAQDDGRFGYSVAVSSTTVAVGAIYETAEGQTVAGHAYSFDASTGFLTTTLTSENAQAGGQFGFSVAISCGDPTVVVGAQGESAGFSQAGHAYIFYV